MGPGLFVQSSASQISLGDQKRFLRCPCLILSQLQQFMREKKRGRSYSPGFVAPSVICQELPADDGCSCVELQCKGGFAVGHGKVVARTCPGVGEDPAALASRPSLTVSCSRTHRSKWSARLANIALLMLLLLPRVSVLEKGAVSSHFSRKAALLAGEKAATL